jgi:hypothetical protein
MALTIQQGGGSGRAGSISIPSTRAELDALMMRRGELRSQLRNSEERRSALVDQASRIPPDNRGIMNQRIATLDARIAQIEAQLLQLDEAVSAGMANAELIGPAGQAVTAAPSLPAPSAPEAVVVLPPSGPAIPIHGRDLAVGGLLTLSLFALVGWLMWRRAVATLTRNLRASPANADEMRQLQQSVDAIAVEVERISENQRYVTKLLNQQLPGIGLGAGHADLEQVPAPGQNRGK